MIVQTRERIKECESRVSGPSWIAVTRNWAAIYKWFYLRKGAIVIPQNKTSSACIGATPQVSNGLSLDSA